MTNDTLIRFVDRQHSRLLSVKRQLESLTNETDQTLLARIERLHGHVEEGMVCVARFHQSDAPERDKIMFLAEVVLSVQDVWHQLEMDIRSQRPAGPASEQTSKPKTQKPATTKRKSKSK